MKRFLQTMLLGLGVALAGTAQAQKLPFPFPTQLRLPVAPAPVCTERRLLGSGAPPPSNSVTVTNKTGSPITIHLGFLASSCYQPGSFSSFCSLGSNQYICTFPLDNDGSQVLDFTNSTCQASFALAVNQDPWQSCSNSFAEFTLHDFWSFNNTYQDTFDISLVNGFSYPISVTSSGLSASVKTATGNQENIGVYPLGCSTCTGQAGTPCPGDVSQCKTNQNSYPCQLQQASGNDYTVTFNGPPEL